jgi:dTDP-4-dehydrorhamnose reductase
LGLRALVIGGSGFVGQSLLHQLGPDASIGTFHQKFFPGGIPFDAAAEDYRTLRQRLPDGLTHVFVNHGIVNPEACAADPAGTARVNVDSICRLLEAAMADGLFPIFLSTDYVFDGTRGGWTEADTPRPVTQYGLQKLAVERYLQGQPGPSLVVRLGKVVGAQVDIHSVLGQAVPEFRAGKPMRLATDQIMAPVWVQDAAALLLRLAAERATGLFHIAGPERYSRLALMALLQNAIQAVDPSVRVVMTPCSLHDLPFRERRPLDTSLSNGKLQARYAWPFKPMAALCAEIAEAEFRR